MLKKNIKRVKQVLEEKNEISRANQRKLNGRESVNDSTSMRDTDMQSMASVSALGAGPSKVDIKKVEMIN